MTQNYTRTLIKSSIFILILSCLTVYALYQSRNMLKGPVLNVISPVNGARHTTSVVNVSGNAKNISYLTLNGAQIFTDENGNFSRNTILLKGYNTLAIEARDKFGRVVSKNINLIYKN
jgi:hypothetical protein